MDNCLNACPNDSYVHQYRDGSLACFKCSALLNTRLNANRTGCECKNGYEFSVDATRCVVKSTTFGIQIVDNSRSYVTVNKTVENPSSVSPQNLRIVSPSPTIFSTIIHMSNTCVSQIVNSYFDGTACSCKVGFKNVSNSCIPIN